MKQVSDNGSDKSPELIIDQRQFEFKSTLAIFDDGCGGLFIKLFLNKPVI
jgi:hypothetical protein